MFSRAALISTLAISIYSYSLTNLHIIINLISFSPNYFSENKNLVKKNFRKNLKLLNLAERPQQKAFAEVVKARLADESASFIEAPTGIGKTYAYLLTLLGQGKKLILSVDVPL